MSPTDPAMTPTTPAITPDLKRDPKDHNQVLLGDDEVEDDADD
jgi:hypothetical protein